MKPKPEQDDPKPRVALAVEVSPDRSMVAVAAAYKARQKHVVELLAYLPRDDADLLAGMKRQRERLQVATTVIDPHSGATNKISLVRDAGFWVEEPTSKDVAVAWSDFLDMLVTGELLHVPSPPLDAAIAAIKDRSLAGGRAFDRYADTNGVDVAPVTAAVLALWGYVYHGQAGVGVMSIAEAIAQIQAETPEGQPPRTVRQSYPTHHPMYGLTPSAPIVERPDGSRFIPL